MRDKALIWLDSKPLISINRLCKMVNYNMANFKKMASRGVISKNIRNELVSIISDYGYIEIEVSVSEMPKILNAPRIEIKDDEFRVPPKRTEKVDYEKLLSGCEFQEEFRALWERIDADNEVSRKEKDLWRIRLNAK